MIIFLLFVRPKHESLYKFCLGGLNLLSKIPEVFINYSKSYFIMAGFIIIYLSAETGLFSPANSEKKDENLTDADSVITLLYDLVTIKAGDQADWNTVESLFIKDAVICLRTTRDQSTIFSVEGFIEDFQNFIDRANIIDTGFEEIIVNKKTVIFGDIAYSLVVYQASIPGAERPPQQGVDIFQLIKKENRWWIVAITNEIPTKENPIPSNFLNPFMDQ